MKSHVHQNLRNRLNRSSQKKDPLYKPVPVTMKVGWTRFDQMIILPQMRTFFDQVKIHDLAQSIAKNGMLHPPIVTTLSRKRIFQYISFVEKFWGRHISTKVRTELQKRKSRSFTALIAGECRTLALMHLWDKGCDQCQEKAKENKVILRPGECLENHFEYTPQGGKLMKKLMKVDIVPLKISLEQCMDIQLSENIHGRPTPHEEAHALSLYYEFFFRLARTKGRKYSLELFAREQKRPIEVVRRAIWYCELPTPIRLLVEKQKVLSYSAAVELHRLYKDGTSLLDLLGWAMRIKEGKWSAQVIRQRVQDHFNKKRHENFDLFKHMNGIQEISVSTLITKSVSSKTQQAARDWEKYFRELLQVIEFYETAAHTEVPISLGVSLNLFSRIIEIMEKIVIRLGDSIPKKDARALKMKVMKLLTMYEIRTKAPVSVAI